MVQIVGVHGSHKEHRRGIARKGLLARKPCEHNFAWFTEQPKGVYVMLSADPKDWWWGPDFYEVAYCGPLRDDPELVKDNDRCPAVIIPDDVPPSNVRFISQQEHNARSRTTGLVGA